MSRLLVIFCPVNPRTLNQVARDDIDVAGPAERFRWCLIEHQGNNAEARIDQESTGTLSNVPFADEALVIMPTVDVRLVRTKVPLISGKKLEALLPTLAEPYLLDQRTPLRYQLLPPTPGATGVDRTIAITSESWMTWLSDQLAQLPVRTLTLIPDCLLLDPADDSGGPSEFLVDQQNSLCIFSAREGSDWGAGWIEADADPAVLAALTPNARRSLLNNAWLMPRALAWLANKSPINLIQRQTAKKPEKRAKDHRQNLTRWRPKVEWAHWQQPLRLAAGLGAVYILGSVLYLGVLAISNWRWQNTLAETTRQHLATPVPDNAAAIAAFIRQASAKVHAQGKDTPADFLPMAGKLQILLNSYPAGILESVQYQSNGLAFTLRNGKGVPESGEIAKRARDLEIALLETGKNEYRMLPLAGLAGSESR